MRAIVLLALLLLPLAAGPVRADRDPCGGLKKQLDSKVNEMLTAIAEMEEWHAKCIAQTKAKGDLRAAAKPGLLGGAKEILDGACDVASGDLKTGAKKISSGYMLSAFSSLILGSGVDISKTSCNQYEMAKARGRKAATEADALYRRWLVCCRGTQTGGSGIAPSPRPTGGPGMSTREPQHHGTAPSPSAPPPRAGPGRPAPVPSPVRGR